MLVQFSLNNYLSFKDQNFFSMIATKRRSQSKELDNGAMFSPQSETITAGPEFKLLKTVALYGANGSGKSNMVKGLQFLKNMVINSSKETQFGEDIPVKPFKFSLGGEERPSEFSITFIVKDVLYQYEMNINPVEVVSETLQARNLSDGKDRTLFSRKLHDIKVSKSFREGEKLESKTRKNSLFLSVCANFDGAISTSIVEWFRKLKIISGVNDTAAYNFTVAKLRDEVWNKKISILLSSFDLGIQKLVPSEGEATNLTRRPDGTITFVRGSSKLQSFHNRYDEDGRVVDQVALDLREDESEGTQKLVALAGPIIDSLDNPNVLVIDEFDSKLHPLICRAIVTIFNSEFNSKKAQLIVASHDTNILDKAFLRRDQIWLVEKDLFGGSHLHSLVEYKVRNDASYELDYFKGKYGGIPITRMVSRESLIDDGREGATEFDDGE